MILVFAAALLALAAYLVAESATAPARLRTLALRRAASYGGTTERAAKPAGDDRLALLRRLQRPLATLALKVNPRTSEDAVRAKLLAAGFAGRVSPIAYLALKAGTSVSLLLLTMLFGGGGVGLLLGLALAAGAFLIPDFLLSSRAKSRRETIRAQLPDALDLLTVSVEAGLGFDAALAKLGEHMDGPVAEEFTLTLSEMRVGETRHEALKRMAERTSAPEVAAFARSVIQSDQLGLSLGRILRAQAGDVRNRRQTEAEERAMKAPIKMLFPTVLFIFPALFVVIVAPAVMTLVKVL